jgi:hypothetical protein
VKQWLVGNTLVCWGCGTQHRVFGVASRAPSVGVSSSPEPSLLLTLTSGVSYLASDYAQKPSAASKLTSLMLNTFAKATASGDLKSRKLKRQWQKGGCSLFEIRKLTGRLTVRSGGHSVASAIAVKSLILLYCHNPTKIYSKIINGKTEQWRIH